VDDLIEQIHARFLAEQILSRFEARADEIVDEIAASTVAEVDAFRNLDGPRLDAEMRVLATCHLDTFLQSARTGAPPSKALSGTRERAMQRAREMLPLSALVHSYLIAQRVISASIAREAESNIPSRNAALELTAMTFDYNIAVTAVMAEAYLEVVRGDLSKLASERRELIGALLTGDPERRAALDERAVGLGLDSERQLAVVVAVVVFDDEEAPSRATPPWAAQAVARCSGRPERAAFVVDRERDVVAVLEVGGSHPVKVVLERAAKAIRQTHSADLRAGVGVPFFGLAAFADSYREALRALRHTSAARPFVFGPEDVPLFDELTISAPDDAHSLIPEATRQLLADDSIRETIEAFFAADLQVSAAARALALHPNSLRYRLARIANRTGRDPRNLADLIELITALRLLMDRDEDGARAPAPPTSCS
jgi:sugar diacid utilization regulator